MQIDALVVQPRARATIRSLLPGSGRPQRPASVVFVGDWQDLLVRADQGTTDVAIADPWDEARMKIHATELHLLRRRIGTHRIVLYLAPNLVGPVHLVDLKSSGFQNLILAGIDDRGGRVEQTLAAALAAALLDRVKEILGGQIPEPALGLFLDGARAWRPGEQVAGVAKCLGLGERGFRHFLKGYSLPAPGECLAWGRLFFALGYLQFQAATISKLAYRLGYEDRSSLYRLCDPLIGLPAAEVFSEQGTEVVVKALAHRLAV